MYMVRWERSALDELAAVWLEADTELRQDITAATHALDGELGSDPCRLSESRDTTRRVVFLDPLGIYFSVDEAGRVVSVLSVWRVRRRQR